MPAKTWHPELMHRTLRLSFALLVVVASLVWGFAILTADVRVDVDGAYGSNQCGSVYAVVLDGHAQGGGEVVRPDEECVAKAREAARGAIAPAVAGLVGLGYLGVRWIAVVREAKREGRSRGALTS